MCTGASSMYSSDEMMAFSGAMQLVSGALGAKGALDKGRQEKAFYDYRASQLGVDAEAERQMGVVRAGKIRKAGTLVQGEARAAYAGSGIDVNTGTPLAIREQIDRNVGEDAFTQILSGARRGRQLDAEAALQRVAGENALRTGRSNAAMSLLSGAGKAYEGLAARDRWKRSQRAEQMSYERRTGTGVYGDAEFLP